LVLFSFNLSPNCNEICVYCLLSVVYCFYCLLCLCFCLLYLMCLLCLRCLLSIVSTVLQCPLSIVSTVSTDLLCLLSIVCAVSVVLYISNLQLQTFTPNLPAVMNSCLLPPKLVTDGQTTQIFHPPPHIAFVQLFQLNKMSSDPPAVTCTSSTKPFRDIANFIAMSQYCGELWVSRKGNEAATNETSSRYYFILLRDVVKCLRTLNVANVSPKWMLR
jgi:hypothetical protein